MPVTKSQFRRRLTALIAIALLGALTLGATYAYRRHQARHRDVAIRAEALAAAQAGNHLRAVALLEDYMPRHPDDLDAVVAYVAARPLVVEPDQRHLSYTTLALRHLLRAHPDRVEQRRQLLDLYVETGYSAEALDTATMLIDKHQDRAPQTLRGKALALGRLRRTVEGLAAARDWAAAAPRDLQAHMLTLSLMADADRPDGEIRQFASRAFVNPPDLARANLVQGAAHLLTDAPEDRAKAIDFLAAAAKAAPDDDRTLGDTLARQLDAAGRPDLALDVVQRLHAKLATPDLRDDLARRLFEAGRAKDVVALFADKPAELPNTSTELLGLFATSLQAIARGDEARQPIEILKSRQSDHAAIAWSTILAHADAARVIAACQRAIEKNAANAYLRFFLGEAYASVGEGDVAVRVWRESADATRAWTAPLVSASQALLEMGRFEQGYSAAEQAVRRAPANAIAQLALARAWGRCLEAGLLNGTESTLLEKTADSVQPEVTAIRATLLLRIGRKNEARDALADLANLAGNKIDQPLLLRCAELSARYDLGLEQAFFDRCEREHGASAELAYALATREHARGQHDAALAAFARLRAAATSTAASAGDAANAAGWQLQWARYLETVQDPRAKDVLITLADERASDIAAQKLALAAASTRGEHAFRERAVDRLRKLLGDSSLGWRVAKARLLLDRAPDGAPPPEALILLRDAVTRAPRWSEPRLLLSAALRRQGRIDDAIRQLEEAARGDVDADLMLAGMYRQAYQIERAREIIERLRAKTPEDARAGVLAAELLVRQGKPDEAERAIAKFDDLTRASFLARHDAVDRAIALLEGAVAGNPKNSAVWRGLLEYQSAAARTDDAAATIERAVAALPDDVRVKAIRAHKDLLAAAQDPALRPLVVALVSDPAANAGAAEALKVAWTDARAGLSPVRVCEQLREIGARHPRLLAVQLVVAHKSLDVADFAAATDAAQRAAQMAPELPTPYRLLAEIAVKAAKHDDALRYATRWRERALDRPIDPDLAIARAYLALNRAGDARKQLAPYLKAAGADAYTAAVVTIGDEQLFEPLLETPAGRITLVAHASAAMTPDAAHALLQRIAAGSPPDAVDEKIALSRAWAELAERTADPELARAARDVLAATAGDSPYLLMARASRSDQDGAAAAAEKLYRQVIAAGPAPVALNNLAMLLAKQGGDRIAEARRMIDDAIAIAPGVAALHDTRAFVLAAGGDPAAAVACMYNAIQLDGASVEYQVRLAELLIQSGQRDKAREVTLELARRGGGVAAAPLAEPLRKRLESLRGQLSVQTAIAAPEARVAGDTAK